jgi:hypothetical protein
MKTYFEGYEEIALPAWGFALETSVHFLRLVFAGVFDAYPRLKFILAISARDCPLGSIVSTITPTRQRRGVA